MIHETNPLPAAGHQFEADPIEGTVYWTDPMLASIERLRLISDPGFPMWDVSYCHGRMIDGTRVEVRLPFHQLQRNHRKWTPEGLMLVRAPSIMAQVTAFARKDRVFAKGLGIAAAISTLV